MKRFFKPPEPPEFDPYGVTIIQEKECYFANEGFWFEELDEEYDGPRVVYKRTKVKQDLWFQIEYVEHTSIIECLHFCYWTHNNSYIDCLEDAIFQFITTFGFLFKKNLIAIEADKFLRSRLISCRIRSRLWTFIFSRRMKIIFLPRETSGFKVHESLRKTIPRTVIEGSTQYWALFQAYKHLQESEEEQHNIFISALHFTQFRIFSDWNSLWKVDFHTAVLLSGGWRSNDIRESCPNCGTPASTKILIFGCCELITAIVIKKNKVTNQNFVRLISIKSSYRQIGYQFRMNLNKLRIK